MIRSGEGEWRVGPVARSGLIAVAIIVLVFPDVLFLGASLAPSNAQAFLGSPPGWRAVSLYPHVRGRLPAHGMTDAGAGALQFEPAQAFMARVLAEGDSPWWNPYSASGSLGPETLSDGKLSPLTLVAAAGGGGQAMLHSVLLATIGLALLCFHLALTEELGASSLAATLGCVVFLLNGFSTSYLGTQIAHPYLLSAPLLLALLRATRAPTPLAVASTALAHAAVFMTTFLPLVLIVLLSVHTLVLVERKGARRALLIQVGGGLVGALLVAWLWLPVFESFLTNDLFARYSERTSDFIDAGHLLSAVSPKHFWESGQGLYPPGQRPAFFIVHYTGVVPLLVVAAGLARSTPRGAWAGAGLVAVTVLRSFDVPVLGYLLARAPGLSIVRTNYWGAAMGIGLAFCVARGLPDAGRLSRRGLLLLAVTLLGLMGWVGARGGTLPPWPFSGYVMLLCILVVIGAALLLSIESASPRQVVLLRGGVALLVLVELVFHQNTLRSVRFDQLASPPPYVEVVRRAAAGGRVLNAGFYNTLTPDAGSALGIRQADTLNIGTLPWYRAMFVRGFGLPDDNPRLAHAFGTARAFSGPVLDQLAIRCITVAASEQRILAALRDAGYPVVYEDDARSVFGNPTALPRAWAAPALVRAAVVPEARGSAARAVAVTEDAELLAAARAAGIPADGGGRRSEEARVTLFDDGNARMSLDVDLPWPGLVVVADTWHPTWRARAEDGRVRPIGRVNEALRGIPLPAGRHRLVLTYRPRTLSVGLAVAAVTAAGLIAWALGGAWRGRRGSGRVVEPRAPDVPTRPEPPDTLHSIGPDPDPRDSGSMGA